MDSDRDRIPIEILSDSRHHEGILSPDDSSLLQTIWCSTAQILTFIKLAPTPAPPPQQVSSNPLYKLGHVDSQPILLLQSHHQPID